MAKQIKIVSILLILIQFSLQAQDFRYGYLVEFTDKENTPYTIDKPNEFLSERAIQRRQKWEIEISEQDFPVNSEYIAAITEHEGVLHVTSKWLNSAVFYTENSSFNEEVAELDFVEKITLVYEQLPVKKSAINSKWVNEFDDTYYGDAYNQMEMLNAQELHHRGYLGEGIQIAVLDGGFWKVDELSCFKSLWDNNRILDTYDYINHDANVFDDHTHGMGVLSIIASDLPGELMGGAPEASFYLYRTENTYSEYLIEEENWIAGAEKADSAGADIITASLGYSVYDNAEMNHSYADMDGKTTRITQGAEIAFTKGMFIVNSAGNEGNNDWYYMTAPSDGEHVLCIGAVDENEEVAFFSSRGPSYDNRTKPDVVAKGLGTALINSDGTVGAGNGTSYSCPVITGMVACLWQALPEYSNQELLDFMRSISDKAENPDNTFGYGIPDFSKVSLVLDVKEYDPASLDDIVKVYPNPFVDELSFHLFVNKGQEVEVTLSNLQGKTMVEKIIELNANSYNLIELNDLDNLVSGCYLLNVKTESAVLTKKIVRN